MRELTYLAKVIPIRTLLPMLLPALYLGFTALAILGKVEAAPPTQARVSVQNSASIGEGDDPAIETALGLMSQTASGRPLANLVHWFRASGGVIALEEIPAPADRFILGALRGVNVDRDGKGSMGRISINSRLNGSPEVMAAAIAREASRLEDELLGGSEALNTGMGCLDSGAKALVSSMSVWGELRRRMPSPHEFQLSMDPYFAVGILEREYALFSRLSNEPGRRSALPAESGEMEQVYAKECAAMVAQDLAMRMDTMVASTRAQSAALQPEWGSWMLAGQREDEPSSAGPAGSAISPWEFPGSSASLLLAFDSSLLAGGLLGIGIGGAGAILGQIVLGIANIIRASREGMSVEERRKRR